MGLNRDKIPSPQTTAHKLPVIQFIVVAAVMCVLIIFAKSIPPEAVYAAFAPILSAL